MKEVLAILLIVMAATFSFARQIIGDWNGTLELDGGQLQLVLNVNRNNDATVKARQDIIAHNACGIPVSAQAQLAITPADRGKP